MIAGSYAVSPTAKRSGITLTEILISILILGIGMVSLATLFPLGLLKLRDAARLSRSAYLAESAAADLATRGLLAPFSFQVADNANNATNVDLSTAPTLPYWYYYYNNAATPKYTFHNPLTNDTPAYGVVTTAANDVGVSSSQGIPFAYDPLWRFQTIWNNQQGIYLDVNSQNTPVAPEARFASGIGFVRDEPNDTNTSIPSAHGLQRLTNFNGLTATVNMTTISVMPASQYVPSIFVSPEDVVWQDSNHKGLYPMAWNETDPVTSLTTVDSTPSPLVPDLSISTVYNSSTSTYVNTYVPIADWRYSWMFTGRQVSTGTAGATFDGDIVIFENRAFGLDDASGAPFSGQYSTLSVSPVQASGERVVEAVFGYSANVSTNVTAAVGTDTLGNTFGYGLGASKTVLLRWPATTPDPEVKIGSWIADVTYERSQSVSGNRFGGSYLSNIATPLSGQRCHWYQVVKATPPVPASGNLDFGAADGVYRYMVVNVSTTLQAFTALDANANPVHVNAALVSPQVVQVIPRTFTVN